MTIHQKKCKHFDGKKRLQLSCDGMSESKSTSVSIEVFSIRFMDCQSIYPLRLIKPLDKNVKFDHNKQLDLVIDDLLENEASIQQFVADNLKRSVAKGCLCHSAAFPCDYCYARGVKCKMPIKEIKTQKTLKRIREKINVVSNDIENDSKLKEINKELEKTEKEINIIRRSRLVLPSSTENGEPRTVTNMLVIIEKIENDEKLTKDEAKGVVTRSPLLKIPNFNLISDVPTEYLHCVCLGVTKKMIELTFDVGENRSRVTKRKLSSPLLFNLYMLSVKVVNEFSRRNRELDFSVMKGQEFRNVVLFLLPIILECITPPAPERKLWIQFVFIIRACILPIEEFKFIALHDIEATCSQFYHLYEKLFGPQNCTYNTHLVGAHLLEMRYHGPLTLTSAFEFESFYGEIRNSFTPGTPSNLKQIFKQIIMKRTLGYHCCQNSIYYSDHETALQNDTLIYTFENGTHKMYKIFKVEETFLVCKQLGRYNYVFKEMPKLNCSHIGIYTKGLLSSEEINIPKKKVKGKVIEVLNFLITCPNNILREK